MGTFKMFLGIFVIVAGVYVSAKVIPPYFENYQFQDAVKDEATRDSYAAKSEADIQASVFKKAQEYDIPITLDGIHVEHQGINLAGLLSFAPLMWSMSTCPATHSTCTSMLLR